MMMLVVLLVLVGVIMVVKMSMTDDVIYLMIHVRSFPDHRQTIHYRQLHWLKRDVIGHVLVVVVFSFDLLHPFLNFYSNLNYQNLLMAMVI
jgi:hypothetical protein